MESALSLLSSVKWMGLVRCSLSVNALKDGMFLLRAAELWQNLMFLLKWELKLLWIFRARSYQ